MGTDLPKNRRRRDGFEKTGLRFEKVQKGFLKIYNMNKSKYMIINSAKKFKTNQEIIFKQVMKLIK